MSSNQAAAPSTWTQLYTSELATLDRSKIGEAAREYEDLFDSEDSERKREENYMTVRIGPARCGFRRRGATVWGLEPMRVRHGGESWLPTERQTV